jgi:hypothetical protein
MADLTVWPTDGADGSVSSEARWRKMARLWVPSIVDESLGATSLQPTLVAGPTINVAAGACWVDGHYCELASPSSVAATANGLAVVRFTPADNHAELVYRDGVTVPTQTLATWELPIAQMTAGAMADRRGLLTVGAIASGPANAVASIVPAGTTIPGISVTVPSGRYRLIASFDLDVTVAAAGNIAWGYIAALAGTPTYPPLTGFLPRVGIDMNAVRRSVPAQLTTDVTVPAAGVTFGLQAAKQAAGGTLNVQSGAFATWLTATRIG